MSAAAFARAKEAAKALGFDLDDGPLVGAPEAREDLGLTSSEADTLEAYVFLPPGTSPAAAGAVLEDWAAWAGGVVPGYVWSSEPLRLRVVEPGSLRARRAGLADAPAAPALYGRMHFGDAQGDEWWAVWLLAALTARYPGAAAHVFDSDGDVLAIEGAEGLPGWFTPATAAHRTFLLGGRVHMVPRPRGGRPGLEAVPSPAAGAAWLRAHPPAASAAPVGVQEAVRARLATFPAAASESVHVARCVLPVTAARVLGADPSLAAPAVAAFYGRDPADVQRASRMRGFPPGHGLVPTSVPLSRLLAAQLLMQRYHPPAALVKAGAGGAGGGEAAFPAAPSAGGAPPPGAPADPAAPLRGPLSASDLPRLGSPDYRAWDLGLKLTAGLEILLWQGAGWRLLPWLAPPGAPPAPGGAHADDLARFVASLTRRGYFEGCRTAEEKAAKTARAHEYWAATRRAGSAAAPLPPAGGGGATPDGAVLEDAAEEVVAPPASAGGRLEPPSVRVARALLAVCAPDGSPRHPASSGAGGPWPPPCDRDDPWGWLEEAPESDADEEAALAADRARLTSASAAMLPRLGFDPLPPPLPPAAAAAGASAGGEDEDEGATAGAGRSSAAAAERAGGAVDGGDDDSDDDGDDDDDDDDDSGWGDSDVSGASQGGDDEAAEAEIAQLNALVKTLGGFLKGAAGPEGVEPEPPAKQPRAAGAPAPADAGGFGTGLARSALAGAFAKRPSTQQQQQQQHAPGGTPAAASTAPPAPAISPQEFAALLEAHRSGTAPVAATQAPLPPPPLGAQGAPAWDSDDAAMSAPPAGNGEEEAELARLFAPDEEEAREAAAAAAARLRAAFGPATSAAGGAGKPRGGAGAAGTGQRVRFAGDDSDSDDGTGAAARRAGRFGGDDGSSDDGGLVDPYGGEPEPTLEEVMAAMDEALAQQAGSLGASFATVPRGGDGEGGDDDDDGGDGGAQSGGAPRARRPPAATRSGALLSAGALTEADVRYNLVSSLMESVGGQGGAAGPATNLLGQLGVQVPKAWWRAPDDGGDAGGEGAPPRGGAGGPPRRGT